MSVDSVEESLRVHADRYLQRVFTPRELEDCATPAGPPDARRLAARFAAKEAAMKVLRLADEPLPWRTIGVRSGAFGRPRLELDGAAARLAEDRGVESLDVSLTHEGPFAAAVVVAQIPEGR